MKQRWLERERERDDRKKNIHLICELVLPGYKLFTNQGDDTCCKIQRLYHFFTPPQARWSIVDQLATLPLCILLLLISSCKMDHPHHLLTTRGRYIFSPWSRLLYVDHLLYVKIEKIDDRVVTREERRWNRRWRWVRRRNKRRRRKDCEFHPITIISAHMIDHFNQDAEYLIYLYLFCPPNRDHYWGRLLTATYSHHSHRKGEKKNQDSITHSASTSGIMLCFVFIQS